MNRNFNTAKATAKKTMNNQQELTGYDFIELARIAKGNLAEALELAFYAGYNTGYKAGKGKQS